MESYTRPTMSILVATAAIGIASVATPVRAAPGFTTGLSGSVCAATQNHFPKLNVFPNGAVANKSTTASAMVSCPIPLEFNRNTNVFVSWAKRDGQTLTCAALRRSFDYLSGASSTQSSNVVGTGSFAFNFISDFFNTVLCTIPRNNGNGQNAVNGILWQN